MFKVGWYWFDMRWSGTGSNSWTNEPTDRTAGACSQIDARGSSWAPLFVHLLLHPLYSLLTLLILPHYTLRSRIETKGVLLRLLSRCFGTAGAARAVSKSLLLPFCPSPLFSLLFSLPIVRLVFIIFNIFHFFSSFLSLASLSNFFFFFFFFLSIITCLSTISTS